MQGLCPDNWHHFGVAAKQHSGRAVDNVVPLGRVAASLACYRQNACNARHNGLL
jgi:hypothetical protein